VSAVIIQGAAAEAGGKGHLGEVIDKAGGGLGVSKVVSGYVIVPAGGWVVQYVLHGSQADAQVSTCCMAVRQTPRSAHGCMAVRQTPRSAHAAWQSDRHPGQHMLHGSQTDTQVSTWLRASSHRPSLHGRPHDSTFCGRPP
jgi:hypothetical protein